MTWQSVLLTIISAILTGLASWGVKVFTAWLNTKIKNEKLRNIFNQATETVSSVVRATYQTYVQKLKETGKFDAEAQKAALNEAMTTAKSQLSTEVTDYLNNNNIGVDNWLRTQIESAIYKLKNNQSTAAV